MYYFTGKHTTLISKARPSPEKQVAEWAKRTAHAQSAKAVRRAQCLLNFQLVEVKSNTKKTIQQQQLESVF